MFYVMFRVVIHQWPVGVVCVTFVSLPAMQRLLKTCTKHFRAHNDRVTHWGRVIAHGSPE